jgi:16S rRNA (adenine(1408)-N(1))-methyltransferase
VALLARTAWRAGRKPSRGGVTNLVCVAGTARELSSELAGVADRLTVILPWGELLCGLLRPEEGTLKDVATLCRQGASIEVVASYDPRYDARLWSAQPAFAVDSLHVGSRLPACYQRAGLCVVRTERLDQRVLLEYPTTWAKRLAHGRPRVVWRIQAVRSDDSPAAR